MIAKFNELYKYRELLAVFTRKELKVKYKNSALGFVWSLINPLIMAGVYTLVFGVLYKSIKTIDNFPLFVLLGLLPWNFLTIAITTSTSSIMTNANLIKKVVFPREIIPLSIVLASLVNFMLEMVVILIILLALGYNFVPYIPIFILVVFLQLCATIGFSFFFSAVTVYFRDIEQLITIFLTLWFFATPIIYDLSLVSDKSPIVALLLKIINPMTSVVLLYRQSLMGLSWPSVQLLAYAIVGCFTILIIGYATFAKLSPNFAKEV